MINIEHVDITARARFYQWLAVADYLLKSMTCRREAVYEIRVCARPHIYKEMLIVSVAKEGMERSLVN